MKKINLTKYGFERYPEADFSDDGNRFTCYKVGNIEVSKLVADGDAYIAGRVIGGKLPYDVYSQLPHYKNMDDLNGVSADSLTDEDLQKFYNDCVEYEKEYNEAIQNIEYPSLEELKNKYESIKIIRQNEWKEVCDKIKSLGVELFINLNDYQLKNLINNIKHLNNKVSTYDTNKLALSKLNTAASFTFMKDNSHLEPSWEYKSIMEILNNI